MESWRSVWRRASQILSTVGLEKLQELLEKDDRRLVQGCTTVPPPLQCVQDWPVEAACLFGLCGWLGLELDTVGEVEEYFANKCFHTDQVLNEPAGCRWLLHWFDETPREQMIADLLPEVKRSLSFRRLPLVPLGVPVNNQSVLAF